VAPFGRWCVLHNCILTGNSAERGGGVCGGLYGLCVLYDCTLTGNSAKEAGGGVGRMVGSDTTLYNSIAYFNTAPSGANCSYGVELHYCCTTPEPDWGVGNITNAPLLVDFAGGNLRLQSNSPCINAGNNSYLADSSLTDCFDLDGNPRIVRGTVDIGAYEFQGPGSVIFLRLAPALRPAHRRLGGCHGPGRRRPQHLAGVALSDRSHQRALRLAAALGLARWHQRDRELAQRRWRGLFSGAQHEPVGSPPFTLLAPNLPGQPGAMSFTDTNAALAPRLFYRVGVQ